jgi:hypothetical protein
MTGEERTTSVALYFDRNERDSIPLRLFERAVEIIERFEQSPILFTADGGNFSLDDCYLLAEPGRHITLWGDRILARRQELIDALRDGIIEEIGMDVPRIGAASRSEWYINISISLTTGVFYLGVNQNLNDSPISLLHEAYGIVEGLFTIGYGIAYTMPLAEEPDSYATGSGPSSYFEVVDLIHHRNEWECREKSPDNCWQNELNDGRRHLNGLFRGVYTASILSDSHVRSAGLNTIGTGKLSKLTSSLWVWEVSDTDIPAAYDALKARGVLVGQGAVM